MIDGLTSHLSGLVGHHLHILCRRIGDSTDSGHTVLKVPCDLQHVLGESQQASASQSQQHLLADIGHLHADGLKTFCGTLVVTHVTVETLCLFLCAFQLRRYLVDMVFQLMTFCGFTLCTAHGIPFLSGVG